jgi:hypothetical protein
MPNIVEQLKADASYEVATSATVLAAWGSRAQSSATISPYLLQADAAAEAMRQLALLSRPLAEDVAVIAGNYSGFEGAMIVLSAADFGYDAGAPVLVTGVEFDDAKNMSKLTVLRRLA